MENFAGVHDALDKKYIFTHVIFFVQNVEFGKLRTPRRYVHVRLWPLKAVAVQSRLECLNNMLPVVLVCIEVT